MILIIFYKNTHIWKTPWDLYFGHFWTFINVHFWVPRDYLFSPHWKIRGQNDSGSLLHIQCGFRNPFFHKFWFFWKTRFGRSVFWTFLTHKAYETSHKNYAATKLLNTFKIFFLIFVRRTFTKTFLSADSKRLISLMSQIVSQIS